jgi:phosphate-selective porin OprO and OprP
MWNDTGGSNLRSTFALLRAFVAGLATTCCFDALADPPSLTATVGQIAKRFDASAAYADDGDLQRTFVFPQLRPFQDTEVISPPRNASLRSIATPRPNRLPALVAHLNGPQTTSYSNSRATPSPVQEAPSNLGTVGNDGGESQQTDSRGSAEASPPNRIQGHENFGTVGGGEEAPALLEGQQAPYRPDMPARRRRIHTSFSNGLTWRSEDNYFALTFHNLTQFDLRVFNPTGDPLVDSFTIPRQRWYFEGHVSDYVSYYTVINRGYGTLDLLDSFVDFNFEGTAVSGQRINKAKIEIRVGRMKTPYTYEYIKMSENNLVAAERSVFVGNVAGNRQLGVMAHGELLDDQFEYAVGVFNGPRRSFEDFNNGKDLFTFINTRPFLQTDAELLQQLNLGGSFNFGREHNPLQPTALRTANDQAAGNEAAGVSPTFLTFNPNDIENGLRMQWSGDVTYYFRSLGIMSGYQGGFQDYSLNATTPLHTRVGMSGYQVTLFYFLTGEEITVRRNLLQPRNPLGRIGRTRGEDVRRGFGAIELFSRFANMHLDGDVLSSGLATATSANNANVTDIGFNWYLNHYVKLTFDWQYSAYNRAVALTPTSTTTFNNLFWFRSQIFF